MGQYYKTYLKDAGGNERAFCSQNAVYMTVHGIQDANHIPDDRDWDFDNPKSYGSLFSGLKLMEHSWLKSDYVNGVVEAIKDNPCTVAWVGDYANDDGDFEDGGGIEGYTREIYAKVWPRNDEDGLPEIPFDKVPEAHETGYLVNHTKGVYLDLGKYAEVAAHQSGWMDEPWVVHPLPLLTCIGNGRGGGDYWDKYPCYDKVGSWAMDTIEYVDGIDKLGDCYAVNVNDYAFMEVE